MQGRVRPLCVKPQKGGRGEDEVDKVILIPLNPNWTLICRCRRVEVVRLLLAAGADVNAAASDGSTPLLFCVRHNRIETCGVVLEAGAIPHAVGSFGTNALHDAAIKGHVDMAGVLLASDAGCGALLREQDYDGIFPLHTAARSTTLDRVPEDDAYAPATWLWRACACGVR